MGRTALIALIALVIILGGCGTVPPTPTATLAPTAAAPEAVVAQQATDPLPTAPAQPPVNPDPAVTTVDPASAAAQEATVAPTATPATPTRYTYRVVASYPHDPEAWTQGLDFDNGALYEGTGDWENSSLRLVDLATGQVLRRQPLPDPNYYGEGITVLGDRIYQITWQQGLAFVYDRDTFTLLETFTYPTEGWGLTHDSEQLIMSDGTATIYFRDPVTFEERGRVTVRDDRGPITMLNELEYIDGEIWANIWMTDFIARIDPATGRVTGWIDLTGLLDRSTLQQPADVLNGIALDEATGKLHVTGKHWPTLFEIEVVPAD